MEAVELPVHVGVGDSSGKSGVEEKRAVRRRLRNAQAEDSVPLSSGWRRGMNEAAGSGPSIYTQRCARPVLAPPLGPARLCATRAGGEGAVR